MHLSYFCIFNIYHYKHTRKDDACWSRFMMQNNMNSKLSNEYIKSNLYLDLYYIGIALFLIDFSYIYIYANYIISPCHRDILPSFINSEPKMTIYINKMIQRRYFNIPVRTVLLPMPKLLLILIFYTSFA